LPSRLRTWFWSLRATAAAASYAIADAAADISALPPSYLLMRAWDASDRWWGKLFVGWSGRSVNEWWQEGSRKMCRLNGQGSRRCLKASQVKAWVHHKRISTGCCYGATCLHHTFQTSVERKNIQLCDWRKETVETVCWQFQGNVASGIFWLISWLLLRSFSKKGSRVTGQLPRFPETDQFALRCASIGSLRSHLTHLH
jgi:hypothetical protein